MRRWLTRSAGGLVVVAAVAARVLAQDAGTLVPDDAAKRGGSQNVHALSRVVTHPGSRWNAANIEIEQDRGRPYVYISGFVNFDAQIYDISKPASPKKIYDWTIENPELHRGLGALDGKYFKIGGKYYYAQSFQFMQGSPDQDLGAVIFDVTGLPDPSKVKVVARIRYGSTQGGLGGFHNTFAYKHSDGRVLYFTTVSDKKAVIWDLSKIVSGADSSTWIVGEVPNATPNPRFYGGMYHDFYIAYDPATHQDKFYGAGLGGFSTWDVTHPEAVKQLFTITSFGQDIAHTFTPSPDGKYAVTETEYQYTPLRIWDLTDAQAGKRPNVDVPLSAWTADWRDLAHNHEVRWPYVFVSAYEDGLQVFSLKDPKHPKTTGHFYTCECQHENGFGGNPDNGWQTTIPSVEQGAFGVDVRNYDGLIVISDMRTGLWLFHMDGFDGWNGRDYGVPNISSVQDYDHGPTGVPVSLAPTLGDPAKGAR